MDIPKNTFSVLIPSRGRWLSLKGCLSSFFTTTRYARRLQIVVTVDWDDPQLPLYTELIKQYCDTLNILYVVRPHSDSLTDDYYNMMARMSSGDILWAMNDDAQIWTGEWDSFLDCRLDKEDSTEKGIFYLDINDSTRNFNNNGEFACFPMLSRGAFNAMGHFFNPVIRTWGADKRLHKVCSKAGCVVHVEGILVNHDNLRGDEASSNMARIFREDRDSELFNERDQQAVCADIEKLKKVMLV